MGVFIGGVSELHHWFEVITRQNLAGWPPNLASTDFGHQIPCAANSLTRWESGNWNGANTWPVGQGGRAGQPHFGSVGPRLCATSSPHVILSMTMPYFGHIEDMHGFWSIWCFSIIWCSWNGKSTNSWNLLVIITYLLYLEWNLGMLVVDMCILWPPTPPLLT
jgi:hypothetical protein